MKRIILQTLAVFFILNFTFGKVSIQDTSRNDSLREAEQISKLAQQKIQLLEEEQEMQTNKLQEKQAKMRWQRILIVIETAIIVILLVLSLIVIRKNYLLRKY